MAVPMVMSMFDIGLKLRYDRPMSLNVSLTPHLEDFIHQTVISGRYQSASEVVRTALRLLEEHEQQKATMLDWLAEEAQKGLDSGPGQAVTPAYWDKRRQRVRQLSDANNGRAN